MSGFDAVVVGADGLPRCPWPGLTDPLYASYHDTEWGEPVHGDRALLERLCLEAFQSGLSWITILRKRPAFREAFGGFEPEVVAGFGSDDVERLLQDASIVRNRRKIEAAVANARATLALGAGGLDALVWDYRAKVDRPRPRRVVDVPSSTAASAELAGRLKQVGFAHLGPTTVYAALQACGVVDDHLVGCHRATG
ncbi:MAG: DNA-3-methyladenine glycosylase I [Actinomycetota bacterium]|nr:DNA-3-methyladenine glycosylase I [Actinomycetota bacterium]